MQEKDLIIIGGGPAGLKAGQEAARNNIEYVILEKGQVGQAWRDIRQEMIMLSPCHPQRDWTSLSHAFPIWKMDVTRPFCYAHEFVSYLQEFQEHYDLKIETNTQVYMIKKQNGLFRIDTSRGKYLAKYVYLSTGFFGNPYIPDIPGMRGNRHVTHSHHFKSNIPHRFRRVVVIGGGNSAAETAIALAGYAQVYLITRRELTFFSRTNNLCDIRGLSESLLLELIRMEIIRYISKAKIVKVEQNTLYLEDQKIESHAIICATGYRPVLDLMGESDIDVHPKHKFPITDPVGLSSSIDNLYFGGPLAYHGMRSLFIHGYVREIPNTIEAISQRLTSAKTSVFAVEKSLY